MGIPYAELIGDPVGHSLSPRLHSAWLGQARAAFRLFYDRTAPAGGEEKLRDLLAA